MTDVMQDRETLITLTSDIVAAHVSNNAVAVDQVSALISGVYEALSGLGVEPAVEELSPEPAVSIRASVRPDHVTCLECGKKMKMLKRHLGTEHNLTTEEYRQRWGLSADHPLVAPNYATRRADLAKKIGLGRKRKAPASKGASAAAESADAKPTKRKGLIKLLNQQAAEGAPAASTSEN